MSKPFNPLKKNKSANTENNVNTTMIASYDNGLTPLSPISGRPMVKAFCRDVPVFCDLENRLVLPVKRAE